MARGGWYLVRKLSYQYDGTNLIGLYSDAGALAKRFVFSAGTDTPVMVDAGSDTGSASPLLSPAP